MPKLVTKFKFIKPQSGTKPGGYATYIAKREGVQKIDDSIRYEHASKKQEDFIKKFVSDFPDSKELIEYSDYVEDPTVENASEFISRAVEENLFELEDKKTYADYIATRPRVQKFGTHGLFTKEGEHVQLSKVSKELNEHEGIVWTAIISLRREDAERLGFNRAEEWRSMLRSHEDALSDALNINPKRLKWYAAFHNEGHHPHVHLIAYSTQIDEGFLDEDGLMYLRSVYGRSIFKNDLLSTYKAQTQSREDLKRVNSELIQETIKSINRDSSINPELANKLLELAQRLSKVKGKKVYGYLSHSLKDLVNEIVDIYAQDDRINDLYNQWYRWKEEILATYTSDFPKRIPLSQNEEFKSIRNEIIREAMKIVNREIVDEEKISDQGINEETVPDAEPQIQIPFKVKPSEYLRKQAEAGDKYCQYTYGKSLVDKRQLSYDPRKGIQWLTRSAQQGYVPAMIKLGNEYLTGSNVPKDEEYALRWYEEAARAGSDFAFYHLGKLYLDGEIVEKDQDLAVRYLKAAARRGNQYAQYLLGKNMLADGKLPLDISEGVEFLMQAADANNQYAEYQLGKFFSDPRYGVEDIDTAIYYLEKSYDQGNPYASYLLAKLYLKKQDAVSINKALDCLSFASEKGLSYADYLIGKIYLYGTAIPKDTEKAMFYLNKAAESGNTYAQQLVESVENNRNWYAALSGLRLLRYMATMIKNQIDDRDDKSIKVDKKLRRKIEEKKQAHGLRQG